MLQRIAMCGESCDHRKHVEPIHACLTTRGVGVQKEAWNTKLTMTM